MPLLAIDNLRISFETAHGRFAAVDGVSLSVRPGDTLCLVGESACGKSTTCHAVLRLTPANGRITGRVLLDGVDILALDSSALDEVRGRDVAMIFQDPISSLNPVHRIGAQIGEVLRQHRGMSASAARAEALRLLEIVGIPDPDKRVDEYPHQLSGGMNQRAGIAMALASRPKLLIADEPTTALDVTIQAQILDLLRALQAEYGMALVLVTHDLGVVAEMADRVAVMYAGRIVEEAPVRQLFASPQHPYTRGLMASIPRLDGPIDRLSVIEGNVPSPDQPLSGCRFAPRCAFADSLCHSEAPSLEEIAPGRKAACFRVSEIGA